MQADDGESPYTDDRVPLLTSLPGLIPGTDPVKDENDIVYLVEIAMDEFGVRDPNGLAAWIQDIRNLAFRSRMIDRTGQSPTIQERPIRTLARYMEERAALLRLQRVTR